MTILRFNRRKTLWFFAFLVVYVSVVGWLLHSRYVTLTAPEETAETTIKLNQPEPPPAPAPAPAPSTPPAQTAQENLSVPFLVQAPFGNWDELHGEACEEASLIMVKHFLKQTKWPSLEAADQEIKDLIAWQTDHGYKVDVSVSELSTIAGDYYGLKTGRVINNPTVANIKNEIAAGRAVIVPAAGRELGNPNFTAPGPPYHMLVVRGYTSTHFITNDPGTRRGENYQYPYERFMDAIHDWNGSVNTISSGPKRVLVFD